MSLEIYNKMKVENEIKRLVSEGKTRGEAAALLIKEDDMRDANYVIDACLMPIDEITEEINRYDSSSPKLDAVKFVNELCNKYNVDKKAVIERIRNVRVINKYNSLGKEKILERLKFKRVFLQEEKDKLNDKSMDTEEKSMYYFGLGLVTILGGIIFYSNPVIVGIIPVVYATSVPTIRLSSLYKKEINLVNQLVDLGKEIEYLEEVIENDKNKETDEGIETTEKQNFEELAVPCDRAFIVAPEKVVEFKNAKSNPEVREQIEEMAERFRVNNLSLEGPTLVKRKRK